MRPLMSHNPEKKMDPVEVKRLRLLARFEQLASALERGEDSAITDARIILSRLAAYGTPAMLRDVFYGVTLVWDSRHGEWSL